jgi:signal transduction histidine kinase
VTPDFNSISLTAMLRKLTYDMLTHSGIAVNIETQDFDEAKINGEQKLTIYRIAQEQSTNIVKYADATEVHIVLATRCGVFDMVIEDNGKGSEPLNLTNGIGLSNIKNRAQVANGKSTILTGAGKGFRLEISMPCAE